MSNYVAVNISYTAISTKSFASVDAVDAKGRKIGLMVSTRQMTAVEIERVSGCYLVLPENIGLNYQVCVQMTKDGKAWGSSQPFKNFKTEAEATEYWADRLATKIAKNWK